MRVFVTGGAGFIGSHTIVQLLRAGHEVLCFDNYANSIAEAPARVMRLAQSDFTVTEGDICAPAALDAAMDAFRPDAVIHFAGLKAVGESSEQPLHYYEANVSGSVALLKAMDKIGCTRIVFSSSATVYDPDQPMPLTEQSRTGPINPYGRCKYFIEHIIRDWAAATSGASAALLRYFNPVGAHASGDIGEDPVGIPNNLVPYIARVAGSRLPHLQVFGDDYDTRDGTGARDYIHVEDLASAHLAALDHIVGVQACDVFNIGTGQSTTVLEMLAAFERAAGKPIPYQIAPRRAGDAATSLANVNKAARVLNWRATHDIDDMCRSSWNWQMRNPDGYG